MKYKPGQSGNPQGKPKGTLNNKTRWLQLLESHADELVEKAIELAQSGDTNILRFCLERIIPKAKDRPISLSLPEELSKSEALFKVGNTVLRDMANQKITPTEAKTLLEVLVAYRDTGLR
jgi:exonuclease III